jgi:hypothetical protein
MALTWNDRRVVSKRPREELSPQLSRIPTQPVGESPAPAGCAHENGKLMRRRSRVDVTREIMEWRSDVRRERRLQVALGIWYVAFLVVGIALALTWTEV